MVSSYKYAIKGLYQQFISLRIAHRCHYHVAKKSFKFVYYSTFSYSDLTIVILGYIYH